MQDKTYNGTVKSVDEYDSEACLWNLVGGNGLRFLQKLADTDHLIEKRNRPLSILLSGKQSTTLYSTCFLRALAMEISCTPAQMLFRGGLVEYFIPSNADSGYIIENIESLGMANQPHFLQILQTGMFTQYDSCNKSYNTYPVFGIVLMTCKDIKQVIPQITKSADYIINIEDLTKEQVRQIIRMRFKYAHVEYEGDKIIEMLAVGNSLRTIVSIMKMAIVEMLAKGRSCLMEQDVLKARECL